MIKDILNIELKDAPFGGMEIHAIKKYVIQTLANESFVVKNFSVLLIKSGRFKIHLEEVTQDLSQQDLLLIPQGSYCSIVKVGAKLQLFLISFTTDFAFQNSLKQEFVDSFAFLINKEASKIKLDKRDFSLLSLIYKLLYFVTKESKQNEVQQELQNISFNLFLYELRLIYSKYNIATTLKFSRKESIAFEFLRILKIHCKKQHNPNFYAGVLSVTRGHLTKMLREVTGQSTKNLITQAVIIEAKKLLQDTSNSVTTIAEELEFSSTSNFSVFFKRHTSFSPSQYRAIIQKAG